MNFHGVLQRNYFCVYLDREGGTDVCYVLWVFSFGPVELFEQFVDCFLVVVEGEDTVGVKFVGTFRPPPVGHVRLEGVGTFGQLPRRVQ